jgi:protein-disulfide isomerase
MSATTLLTRAAFLRALAATGSYLLFSSASWGREVEVTQDMILHDPDAPSAGNPEGDLTIVDFFDYNCPYCKRSAPHLERVVKSDGNIRLMYRDWPILTPTSIIGAKLALAAKYQGKYHAAHEAMMAIPGYGISGEAMSAAVSKADVDIDRLLQDSKTHESDINALIERNLAIADAIGLRGTPGFLVGPYVVNQALDEKGFKQVAADARTKMKGQ